MKKILYNLLCAAAVLVLAPVGYSCSDDEQVDAPAIELDRETITLSRTGLDYLGQYPTVQVSSNVYWKATVAAEPAIDDSDPWLTMDEAGGYGVTDIDFTVTENTSASARKATVTFASGSGASAVLVITQAPGDELLVMYTDDFGSGASNVPVGEYEEFNFSGQGVDAPAGIPFRYEGVEAYVSSTSPSDNAGASGGNNILLDGDGAEFVLNSFRPVYQTDFLITFNAMAEGQTFDTDELLLEISTDGENWQNMPYYRPGGAGWNEAQFDFSLAESYAYVHLRFRTAGDVRYRIDDVRIVLNIPSENVYHLESTGKMIAAETPVYWYLAGDAQYFHKLTFDIDLGTYYVTSEHDDELYGGVSTISFETNGRDLSTADNWNGLIGATGQPYVAGVLTDDHWLWKVPLEELMAGDYVYIKFPTRVSAAGMKYWALEFYDGGVWNPVTDLKQAVESPDILYTHIVPDTDILVEHYIPVTTGFMDDTLKIRFRCAGMVRYGNGAIAPTPTGGTSRISGSASEKPVIDVIKLQDAPAEPEITVSGLTYNTLTFDGSATSEKTFTVRANFLWTIETENLEWATVTPVIGGKDQTMTVSVTPTANEGGMRTGSITIKCLGESHTVVVVQSAAGAGVPELGLPAEWLLTQNDDVFEQYKPTFNGAEMYVAANAPGTNTDARLTFVLGGEYSRTSITHEVGTTGHPFVTGMWKGDYWHFTVPVNNFAGGSKVQIFFLTRSSAAGLKYYRLEYHDGSAWQPVGTLQTATEDSSVRYTHMMNSDGSTNVTVNEIIQFPQDISSGLLQIRFVAASAHRADSGASLNSPSGGTHRIASSGSGVNSPYIRLVE